MTIMNAIQIQDERSIKTIFTMGKKKSLYKKSIGDKNESFLVIFQYCACMDEIFIRNILFKYRHTNDKITKVTKSYFPLSAPDKTPALTRPMPTPAARATFSGGIRNPPEDDP